jgi:hypothetical protein
MEELEEIAPEFIPSPEELQSRLEQEEREIDEIFSLEQANTEEPERCPTG